MRFAIVSVIDDLRRMQEVLITLFKETLISTLHIIFSFFRKIICFKVLQGGFRTRPYPGLLPVYRGWNIGRNVFQIHQSIVFQPEGIWK
jgi:hypothetical protein